MTATIRLAGQLLTADEDTSSLSYRLLPYGEAGRTSVGTVTASAGAIALPEDPTTLVLNEEHDSLRPIGRFASVSEDTTGLVATVRVADTTAGRDALTLARDGLRAGISVEIADPVIRDGKLTAGRLTGAGLVVTPAFPSAQLVAADTGDTTPAPTPKETAMPENTAPALEGEVTIPNAAPLHGSAPRADLGALTFGALADGEPSKLTAALVDLVTTDDAGKLYIKDQEIGELWEARKIARPVVNAIGVKPLNSLTVVGQRKTRGFVVADWAGNKTEIPSSKFSTSRETWQAKAKAAAVDVALELIEFGSGDVMADLWTQAMDSYLEQTEAEVIADALAGATVLPQVPDIISGVSRSAQAFATMGANMDVIVVAPDVYAPLLSMPSADAPWWFQNSANLDINSSRFNGPGINFAVSAEVPAGSAMILDKRAIDYRESKDIKLRAVNVALGGYDLAFIKFNAIKVTDPAAVVTFPVGTTPEV